MQLALFQAHYSSGFALLPDALHSQVGDDDEKTGKAVMKAKIWLVDVDDKCAKYSIRPNVLIQVHAH